MNHSFPEDCSLTHPICQQDLKACRPTLDVRPKFAFIFFAVYFLGVSVLLYIGGVSCVEYIERYDDKCNGNEPIEVSFDIKEELSGNVYFYYQLEKILSESFSISSKL